ncbi:YcdB/YcdC domain-containing protein [Desulfosporosinus sp. OT]|uniref:YcdB/YcdC domain-containing protein n=1 Tax=Desulfosporosinus sp. OT TaxID=913865 RepID=UPI000223A97E|nr:peptidase propeptide and YPEB domain protein [Desulfosporosinus sp. OT]
MNSLVVFMFLIQFAVYPANVFGTENETKVVGSTPAKITITTDQAVQLVKDNFTIPTKYTRLSTGYNDYNNRATYSLNWNSVDQPSGSFNAQVDATTGEIINISQWEGPFQSAFRLPVLSEGEAEKISTALVTKLVSKHQTEIQLVKDEQQGFVLDNAQPFTYNFHWIRLVNGIPFPGNGLNVGVSGDDGSIRNYNLNWTEDLVFPEAKNVILPEKALQVFMGAPMLELQYYIPQMMDPQSQAPQRALLVYQLSNKYCGGAIDALSGKPVTLDAQEGAYQTMVAASTVSTGIPTEAMSPEITTPGHNTSEATQISRDEAVEIVKKMVNIPSDLVLRGSNLNPDWQNPNEQVWNLDWNNQPSDMGEFSFINARVNAETGDFVGFGMSSPANSGDKSNPLSRASAQKLAEGFLQRVQPDRFKLAKLDTENFSGGETSENIQNFHYVRLVNGLPVSRNGMDLTVDAVTKHVINFNLNWSDLNFSSPLNVLSLNQATEQFLHIRPLVLNYSQIFHQNGQQEVRLVYQPNTDSNMYISGMLDAQTGEPVDWYGKSLSQWAIPHHYTDIQGNFAEKEISIMGLAGAFGEYGDTFHPNEKLTVGSLLRAMLIAGGDGRDRDLSDEDILKIAKDRNWLQEDLKLGSYINRASLSKFMIRLINMEASAQIKGIYNVPFVDAKTIKSDSLGYIALAWGLGILSIEGDYVQPDKTVTRAEAAYALVHTYAVELPKNYYIK